MRVDDINGLKHKKPSPERNYGCYANDNILKISWDYSDVNKSTAQKRRIKLDRTTNPLSPKYNFKRKDGTNFVFARDSGVKSSIDEDSNLD